MNDARHGAAYLRWPGAPPRRLFMVGVAGLMTILACAHIGATAHTLSSAPAAQLQLTINIQHEYVPALDLPPSNQIALDVRVSDAQGPVTLSHSQSFACDGVAMTFPSTKPLMVPHQPPGGTYDCLYTDERGQQTSLSIPIPPGTWQIVSPSSSASVAIPPAGGGLMVTYRYPRLPAEATSEVNVDARCYAAAPACQQAVTGNQSPATGRITVADTYPATPAAYSTFAPGQGYIALTGDIGFTPAATGFRSVRVEYFDTTLNYLTWTSAS